MLMMDGQEIINIINNVSSLSKAFGCILASDDVQRILVDVNTTGHAFLQWAKGIFLQQNNGDKEEDNVRTFPIGFILNTGTHQNGGKHWQSIYFDDEGVSYFFDSYGRVAPKIFKRFEVVIRGLYHYFDHYNHNVQRAFNEFTMDNFKRYGFNKAVNSIRRSLADENNMKTAHVRYWNFQIQDDFTNVCGQYSTFFLYNISSNVRNPSKCAYKFFCDNFYYFKTPEEKNKAGFAFSEMIYKGNDRKISLIFYKLFGYKDPNIFS